uniref:Cytochrome c oxidase subunit 2 n=1 Tax=Cepaea nemoralis TaxID=28835 RepID=Q37435_CEPNE|nr:cytochrome oxidase subunit II [Cepaea nemoralis]
MSLWNQINLLDPASLIQQEMLLFHDHAMMLITEYFYFCNCYRFLLLRSSYSSRRVHDAQTLEVVWTILPALLLVTLALPSLQLLPSDEHLTVDTLSYGTQWYWSYESQSSDIMVWSYMTPHLIIRREYRLLEVDNRVVLPVNLDTSLVTTSADVIHAWALPSLGVKMDSVPGRLNMMKHSSFAKRCLLWQCSEICGANHAFYAHCCSMHASVYTVFY